MSLDDFVNHQMLKREHPTLFVEVSHVRLWWQISCSRNSHRQGLAIGGLLLLVCMERMLRGTSFHASACHPASFTHYHYEDLSSCPESERQTARGIFHSSSLPCDSGYCSRSIDVSHPLWNLDGGVCGAFPFVEASCLVLAADSSMPSSGS